MSTGYGVESWCTDSLVTGRLVSGWLVVGQALYRRLITPRGMLQGGDEEAAYGFDVAQYVGAVGVAAAVRALPGLVEGELSKDDRVASVTVTVTSSVGDDGAATVLISCAVTLVDEGETFDLTLSVADGELTLESLQLSEAA